MNRRMTWVVTTPAASRSPRTESRPFVSLLSDFGSRDPSAAICRAVVLSIAPDALVVDITHKVAKYNIRHGALMLWSALPYLPIGAHMAVVDPGVGTARRPIVIETARGDYLVGPDNGLLLPGADRLGGIVRVHAIDNTQYRLPIISATFHGRDLFAPTAAHLAAGVPIEAIGPGLDPHSLAGIDWPPVVVRRDELETTVIYHDTFGNLKLAGLTADLQAALEGLSYGEQLEVRLGRGRRRTYKLPWAQTFGSVEQGGLLLCEDSYGRLCIAQNQGSAAKSMAVVEGTLVTISRVPAIAARAAEPRSTTEPADTAPESGPSAQPAE